MRKLVLRVSQGVPELPEPVRREKDLSIRRIKTFPRRLSDEELCGWMLDRAFVEGHASAIRSAGLAPGSLILFNPTPEKPIVDGLLPADLLYEELCVLPRPQVLVTTLHNLYRRLFLEGELARKERLLAAREAENAELSKVGIALSAERDNDKLLAFILQKVREIAGADAGSLYLLEGDEKTGAKRLRFKIAQNDSLQTPFTESVMALSKRSISGYVASTGTVLNIADAYQIPPDREYGFNRSFDQSIGYRSMSMLTVPMKDHKDQIIGAIQLINRKRDPSRRIATPAEASQWVIPFDEEQVPLVLSLAAQAAVSLENNFLYQEIETLFEGFVKASVLAIESRDPTTSGHSNRVAVYTVGLAQAVDRVESGPYRDVRFTPEQLKEIRYASLLHDFGKVGVREHVLVKAKKLYPAQLELVKMRFDYIRKSILYDIMRERFNCLVSGGPEGYARRKEELDRREREELERLSRWLQTIAAANEPKVLEEAPARALDEIRGNTFLEEEAQPVPFLTDDEYVKLRIRRGSLDDGERKEIESHVTHTFRFLSTIPWTREMRSIPSIAYGHHEKLDGAGYPRGLQAPDIPVQARMMTIADIYDALTAHNRPYKPAVPAAKALDILKNEVERDELDRDLVAIFIESKLWEKKDQLLEGGG